MCPRPIGRMPVATFLLLAPLFSAQYAPWLCPFAAIAAKRRLIIVTGLAVVINGGLLLYLSTTWALGGPMAVVDWWFFAHNVAVAWVEAETIRSLFRSQSGTVVTLLASHGRLLHRWTLARAPQDRPMTVANSLPCCDRYPTPAATGWPPLVAAEQCAYLG